MSAALTSQFIDPVLVSDSDVGEISDKIYYPIHSGANVSYYQYNANTGSGTNAVTFNLQLPNTTSVIGRDMMWQSTITATLTLSNAIPGISVFNYGVTDGFQAFPLNSLINSINVQVNGAQFSNTLYQYRDLYLRTMSKRELNKFASYTPSMPDGIYYSYSSAIGTNNNVLSTSTNQGYDSELRPRGSFVLDSVVVTHNINGGGTDASTISTNTADTWMIVVTATVTEPFLALEPFLPPGKSDGAGGFIGQQNMNIQINLNSGTRLWSTSLPYITGLTLTSCANNVLLYSAKRLNTIEAPKLPRYVVYPYTQIQNYNITNQGGTITAGSSTTVTTSNYQFPRIPSKIYLVVRKQLSSQNWSDACSFLPISSVKITFDTTTGILASATQRQLWMLTQKNMSVECAPSWQEFTGTINTTGVAGTGNATQVASSGAILCFKPAFDFSLDPRLTEGSVGNFNFTAQITFSNPTSATITYEILMLYEEQGIILVSGQLTQWALGIADVELVLKTKEQLESLSNQQVAEQIGGKMNSFHKFVKHVKRHLHHKREQGGSVSAGSLSAGAIHNTHHHHHKLLKLAC